MFDKLDPFLLKDMLVHYVDCKSLLALSLTCKKFHEVINGENGVCDEALSLISPKLMQRRASGSLSHSLLPKLHPLAFYAEINRAQKQFMVSCGEDHTIIAVASNDDEKYDKILTFGGGEFGQLGTGGEMDSESAKEILIPDQDFALRKTFVKSVVGGFDHTLVLLENGNLYGFGNNSQGQLSPCLPNTLIPWPTKVPLPKLQISMISCAKDYSAVVLNDEAGTVLIFGTTDFQTEVYDEDFGLYKLCRGELRKSERVTTVSAGYHHLLLHTNFGDCYSVGRNECGQLGIGSTEVICPTPRRVYANESVAQAAAGENHSIFLTRDGKVLTCGDGKKGQLGNGKYENVFKPTEIKMPSGCFPIIITCGRSHSVILDLDGTVLTCGTNAFGQTAASSPFFAINRFAPVTTGEFKDKSKIFRKLVHIAAGNNHTAVLGKSGNLFMFGQKTRCGGGGFIRRHTYKVDPVKVDLGGGIDTYLFEKSKKVFFSECYVRSRR